MSHRRRSVVVVTTTQRETWDLLPREIAVIILNKTAKDAQHLFYQCSHFMYVDKRWKCNVNIVFDETFGKGTHLAVICRHAYLFDRYAVAIKEINNLKTSTPLHFNTNIVKCSSLSKLMLSNDKQMTERTLAQLTTLSTLELHASLYNVSFQSLDRLDNLVHLSLGNVKTNARDLILLSNLESLRLTGYHSINLNKLDFLPRLKTLSLVNNESKPQKALKLTQLTKMSLNYMGNGVDISFIQHLTSLKSLSLYLCYKFTEECIAKFPRLKKLEICPYTEIDLNKISPSIEVSIDKC